VVWESGVYGLFSGGLRLPVDTIRRIENMHQPTIHVEASSERTLVDEPTGFEISGCAGRSAEERDAIVAELARATGLGGRTRAMAAEDERARVNVTRTLRATIGRIADQAPLAATHLRASIRTGSRCRYEPAAGGPTRWRL
jgi:hypothetical protein